MTRLALIVVLLPLAASAATISVSSTADNTTAGNGECTLREALANVNAAADTTSGDCPAGTGTGDTIKFGFAMPAKIILQLGELEIQRDVSIMNPAPGSLHIDAAGTRVFKIAAGSASMLNLTIEHGSVDDFGGGGVWVSNGATLDLVRSVVQRNQALNELGAGHGGGILNQGTMHLTDCALVGNKAGDRGGGIYNSGDVALVGCRLFGNVATDAYGDKSRTRAAKGGGIYNDLDRTATLTNCTLTKNRASTVDGSSEGGGIYNEGVMTLKSCTLTHNVAEGRDTLGEGTETYGGGISNYRPLTLTDCTLAGNVSVTRGLEGDSFGGAIENYDSLIMTNCTLDHNSAVNRTFAGQSGGGGIETFDELAMTNCTFVRNRASSLASSRVCSYCSSYGGALYGHGVTATNCTFSGNVARQDREYYESGRAINAFEIVLTNTIVADSGAAGNCFDNITSGGHNLSSDGTCFTAGGSDLLNTAPNAVLGNYGGPTRTMALCTGPGAPSPSCHAASAAINAGDDAVTGPPQSLSSDQRGLPRKAGAHVDIGAYEVQ